MRYPTKEHQQIAAGVIESAMGMVKTCIHKAMDLTREQMPVECLPQHDT